MDEDNKLVLEGEWGCFEQECGQMAAYTTIGTVSFDEAVDNFLNIPSENGKSGIKVRVTIERILE